MDATDELITLKGKKTGIRVLMTPLADDVDWATYLNDLKAKARALFNDKFDPLILDLGEKRFVVSKASTGIFNMYPEGGDAMTVSDSIRKWRKLEFNNFISMKRALSPLMELKEVVYVSQRH